LFDGHASLKVTTIPPRGSEVTLVEQWARTRPATEKGKTQAFVPT